MTKPMELIAHPNTETNLSHAFSLSAVMDLMFLQANCEYYEETVQMSWLVREFTGVHNVISCILSHRGSFFYN